jgi:cyclophilin family peptidyl-prolyl cis-trans isomerase
VPNYKPEGDVKKMHLTIAGTPLKRVFVAVGLLMASILPASVTANTLLRMQTDLGGVDIELFDAQAPLTVANFLNYVNRGDYDGTFIHRSVPGFVVQGGGYIFNHDNGDFFGSGTSHIPVDPPVVNEPDPVNRPNLRGTLAMAKTSDPDSATSEWFFNLADNASLDDPNNSGGFTVFGQVTGSGMAVWDAVAGLSRCIDVAPLPFLCGSFTEVPAVNWNQSLSNDTLINIIHIGVDNDGDGIIDSLENAAPNSGDANSDGVRDSEQAGTASFPIPSGEYVVAETESGVSLTSTDVLGLTFLLTTIDPADQNNPIAALEFPVQSGFGSRLSGIATGGSTTLKITLPTDKLPNSYFNYGPESGNPSPHWYEFLFDGETGAEINGNIIILHLVDGKRGDSDLAADGVITLSRGAPVVKPGDADGVSDTIENAAPNNGDANNDGMLDSTQDNVVSFLGLRNDYLTLSTQDTFKIHSIKQFFDDLEPSDPNKTGYENSGILEGLNFPNGFLSFEVGNVNPGGSVTVNLLLPANQKPVTYMVYGPTPDNSVNHWYEFGFDGETGAEINGNLVTLHFVDGQRGDSDLAVNGVIVDPGAPAQKAKISGSSGGGGGCNLMGQSRNPAQAGAWWILFSLILMHRLKSAVRVRTHL